MDLFATADLEALAAPGETGTHVSLFMPTHRSGSELEADPLRWKNLVRGVTSVLAARGERKPDIDALLAPAWELHADSSAWEHMSDGLAVFLRPGWTRVYRVPVDVPEIAGVGDHFVVGPLLRALRTDYQESVKSLQAEIDTLERELESVRAERDQMQLAMCLRKDRPLSLYRPPEGDEATLRATLHELRTLAARRDALVSMLLRLVAGKQVASMSTEQATVLASLFGGEEALDCSA